MPPNWNMASILGIFIFLDVTVQRSSRSSALYFLGKKVCLSLLSKAVHVLSNCPFIFFTFSNSEEVNMSAGMIY